MWLSLLSHSSSLAILFRRNGEARLSPIPLKQDHKYHFQVLTGTMELLLCWPFKEGVGIVMRVPLFIAAYGNKDPDRSRA